MAKQKINTKEYDSWSGFFDDNDEQIHVGNKLIHEDFYEVEVVILANGEYTGKVLNFIKHDIFILHYSLNNGKGYTINKNN